jgi:hypothetical protein
MSVIFVINLHAVLFGAENHQIGAVGLTARQTPKEVRSK